MNKKEVIFILKLLSERLFFPVHIRLAESGFGCSPNARGRSILCVCLGDGEQTRWNRSEFIGVLKDEFLPDWARENLKQYQTPENTQGMEMTL